MIEKSKRGKKTSSEKIVQVVTAKVQNPDKSYRDIADETGVAHSTVGDILKDQMGEVLTSSDKTALLLDTSLEIVNDGVSIIRDEVRALRLKKGSLKINSINDLKQLSGTIEENFKRSQLLQGRPTGIVYSPDQWANMTPEQLEQVSNGEKVDLN